MTSSSWATERVPAEYYERYLVPALFEPWARRLLDLVDPQPGERVLDLACGTGIVARLVAPRVSESGTVIGLDVNPDMLVVARRRAATIRPVIEWISANATDTGLPDAAFDLAFCQHGLQFFPDRLTGLRELRRVMAPRGRVAISVWCDPDSPGYAPFGPALARHLPDVPAAVGFLHAIFGLSDATELYGLLANAGFVDIQISHETGMVCYPSAQGWADAFLDGAPVPAIASAPADVRRRITAEVVQALHEYVGEDGLAFPLAAHVALARVAG